MLCDKKAFSLSRVSQICKSYSGAKKSEVSPLWELNVVALWEAQLEWPKTRSEPRLKAV